MHARPIAVRGTRHGHVPRPRRAPIAALVLSFLAFASPGLTIAPLSASEPYTVGVRPIDDLVVPRRSVARGAPTVAAPEPSPGPTQVAERTKPASPAPPAPPAPSPAPDVEAAAQFQAALHAARARGEAWGVTFAAVRDGEVIWAGASGRQRDGRTALDAASPLVIGSATKTFVAATVLQLADEGRIALSDPVRRHLPEVGGITGDVTIAQLLDHTSGLADVFNDTTRRALEATPEQAWAVDDVLDTLGSPWYAPGEGWAYANTNYLLLGLLVERVTGARLADELDTRFLSLLELRTTTTLDGAQPGSPLQPAWATIFWGSGAMGSSAVDLARWGDALYAGDVLSPSARTAMLRFNRYDYGLGVQRLEMAGTKGYGHTGLLNAYTTLLFHVPAQRTTVALLVNRSGVDLGAMLAAKPPNGSSLLELAVGD